VCFLFVSVFPGLVLSVASEEVFTLLFLLHCENGDFSILMKDVLVDIRLHTYKHEVTSTKSSSSCCRSQCQILNTNNGLESKTCKVQFLKQGCTIDSTIGGKSFGCSLKGN
jgi:hypothetical protein